MLKKLSLWLIDAVKLTVGTLPIAFVVNHSVLFLFPDYKAFVAKVIDNLVKYYSASTEKILAIALRSPTAKFLTCS